MARSQGIYGRICILFLLTHFPPVCFMITDFFLSLTGLITAIVSGTSRASTSPVSAAQRSANIRRRPSRWSRAGWPVWKSVLKRPVKPDSLCWDTRDETLFKCTHVQLSNVCLRMIITEKVVFALSNDSFLPSDRTQEIIKWHGGLKFSSRKCRFKIPAGSDIQIQGYHFCSDQEGKCKKKNCDFMQTVIRSQTVPLFHLKSWAFFVCVIVLINTVLYRNVFSFCCRKTQITIYQGNHMQ